MTTVLTKPVARRIGALVVTISGTGVRLRAAGKRLAVEVTWADVVKAGLEKRGVSLFEREWEKPLEQLPRLAELLERWPGLRRRKWRQRK